MVNRSIKPNNSSRSASPPGTAPGRVYTWFGVFVFLLWNDYIRGFGFQSTLNKINNSDQILWNSSCISKCLQKQQQRLLVFIHCVVAPVWGPLSSPPCVSNRHVLVFIWPLWALNWFLLLLPSPNWGCLHRSALALCSSCRISCRLRTWVLSQASRCSPSSTVSHWVCTSPLQASHFLLCKWR